VRQKVKNFRKILQISHEIQTDSCKFPTEKMIFNYAPKFFQNGGFPFPAPNCAIFGQKFPDKKKFFRHFFDSQKLKMGQLPLPCHDDTAEGALL